MSIAIQKALLCGGDLLPSKQKIEPLKALKLSKIVTEIAIKALRAFLNGEYHQFDALVGDNSCKIRAIKIALIAERCNRVDIERCLEEVNRIRRILDTISITKWDSSLGEFRQSHGIEFSLTQDEAFLVQAHLIVLVQSSANSMQTDPDVLRTIADISRSEAKDWIHKVKERLALTSVQIVQEEAQRMENSRKGILQKMLSPRFIKMRDTRPILTNMHSMEVLFIRVLQERLLIVFIDGEKTLVFHSNEQGTGLMLKTVEAEDLEKPAVLIQGESIPDIPFNTEDFFQLLLIKAGQDPQYLDGERAEKIPFQEDEEDLEIREEQVRFEKCQYIPVPFRINHIMCMQMRHIMHRTRML